MTTVLPEFPVHSFVFELMTTVARSWRPLFWTIPLAALVILAAVGWKLSRQYDPPAAPERAYIRQAPVFQLHDESMKLLRLQRYIGRQKILVAFLDAREGVDHSLVAQGIRENWADFERTGGVVIGITAVRPAENRAAIGRGGAFPFVLLSDLNQLEVHRQWGACDEKTDLPREGVVIVDRAGWIRFIHFAPDTLGTPAQWAKEFAQVR